MDILTLLFLILLSILLVKSNPVMSNIFLILAGGLSATGITTNQITNITGGTITILVVGAVISALIAANIIQDTAVLALIALFTLIVAVVVLSQLASFI